MIVFGWLCLVVITLLVSGGTLLMLYANVGLTGKIGNETKVFGVVAALLIWATYVNFPFVVAVAS